MASHQEQDTAPKLRPWRYVAARVGPDASYHEEALLTAHSCRAACCSFETRTGHDMGYRTKAATIECSVPILCRHVHMYCTCWMTDYSGLKRRRRRGAPTLSLDSRCGARTHDKRRDDAVSAASVACWRVRGSGEADPYSSSGKLECRERAGVGASGLSVSASNKNTFKRNAILNA